jgi:hypothetical protein
MEGLHWFKLAKLLYRKFKDTSGKKASSTHPLKRQQTMQLIALRYQSSSCF